MVRKEHEPQSAQNTKSAPKLEANSMLKNLAQSTHLRLVDRRVSKFKTFNEE